MTVPPVELTSPRCPVCDSGRVANIHPGNVDDPKNISFDYTFTPDQLKTLPVVQCRECTHVFCWPVPPDFSSHYADVIDQEYLSQNEYRRQTAKAVVDIVRHYQPGGHWLDVGCATGDLLTVARDKGYSVTGIELSKWSSTIAREKRLEVHTAYLKDYVEGNEGKFEIVSLLGVIEHLLNPSEEMRHLSRLVKKNGLLVIWTGDYDSISRKIFGRKWWYWLGQHIQYFTHRSLARLARMHGFEELANETYPYAATYENLSNSLKRYSFSFIFIPVLKLMFRIKPVWHFKIPGEMLFIARRG